MSPNGAVTHTDKERHIMAQAENCLNCGIKLRYLERKEARRNRGYCCLNCYYAKPPAMIRVEQEFEGEIAELLVGWLNDGLSQSEIAATIGIERRTLYTWLRKLHIRRVARWTKGVA